MKTLVSNHIREMRNRLGLTQSQAAELAGIDIGKGTFSLIENGTVLPTRAMLAKLCEALQCGVSDLYDPDDLSLTDSGSGIRSVNISREEYDEAMKEANDFGFDGISGVLRFAIQALRLMSGRFGKVLDEQAQRTIK